MSAVAVTGVEGTPVTGASQPQIVDLPDQTKFLEAPGLLMLRLMSRCNEKCVFCMVANEIAASDDIDYREAVRRIEAQPSTTRIEFFGGEPTTYPGFLDLLRLARGRGHSCSIATNCRAFHSEKFTRAVAALGPSMIYVRTSLYGDTEALHDRYTATPHSFRQTVQGVRNLVREGFCTQINFVILAGNYDRLPAMTRLAHGLGVPRVKFGNLCGVASCAAHAVELKRVRPYLLKSIATAERLGLVVTVEKTPICAAGGRIDLISTERLLGHWPRAYDDQGACGRCLVRPWCDGFDPDYAGLHGFDVAEPLTAVDRFVLKGSAHEGGEPDFLKIHCVGLDGDKLDESSAVALYDLLGRVEARLGRLAVFPASKIIDTR